MNRIIVVGMSPYRGGMESYIMNLYRQMVHSGFQFDFYLHHDETKTAYEEEILSLGGRLLRVGYGKRENYALHKKNIKQVLNDSQVVGVYVNACVMVDIDLIKYAKKLKKPIRIFHSHNAGYMSELSFLARTAEKTNKRNIKKYASNLFACSELAGKWMFGKDADYTVIHNGINIQDFKFKVETRSKIRQELGIEDKFVIGTVGRIQYQKNPEFIVEIFAKISKKIPSAVLLWAGDGEISKVQKIKNKIIELNLQDRVFMVGMVDNTNELYQAMDVFVLPSRFEGLPFVLVEAQCAGLPCLVSDTVTREILLTDIIEFLAIDSINSWIEKIENIATSKNERQDKSPELECQGYSIKHSSSMVAEIMKGEIQKSGA